MAKLIGTDPEQVPLNQYLGSMAYQDSAAVVVTDLKTTGSITSGTSIINIGSGQIYKDAAGNVGIGTASPSNPLSVTSDTSAQVRIGTVSANIDARITLAASGTGRNVIGGSGVAPLAFMSAATELMRLDTSGNLGLGTISPTYQFDLQGTGGAPMSLTRFINDVGSTSITLAHSRGTTVGTNVIVQNNDLLGTIVFSGANGTGYSGAALIRGEIDGVPGATADMPGRLTFLTSPEGSATPQERMRIDNAGNLSVGALTAIEKLTVWAGNAYVLRAGGAKLRLADQLNEVSFESAPVGSSSDAIWKTSSLERMRLDQNGNLGLGVTPSAWQAGWKVLEVGNAGNAITNDSATSLRLTSNARFAGSAWLYSTTNVAANYSINNGAHAWSIAPSGTAGNTISFTQAMTLDASGNLGLGVVPSAWGAAGQKAFQLSGLGAVSGGFDYSISTSNNAMRVAGGGWQYIQTGQLATHYQQISGTHTWSTAPSGTAGNAITFTQAMTLAASGNLGVGTTSPAAKLDVTANGRVAEFGSSGAANAYTGWKYNGSFLGYIGNGAGVASGSGATDFSIGSTGARALTFGTNDTERARITSGGNLLVGTTSGIGRVVTNSGAAGNTSHGFGIVGLGNTTASTGGFFSVRMVTINGDGGTNSGNTFVSNVYGTKGVCIAAFDSSGNSVSPSTGVANSNLCTFVAIVSI